MFLRSNGTKSVLLLLGAALGGVSQAATARTMPVFLSEEHSVTMPDGFEKMCRMETKFCGQRTAELPSALKRDVPNTAAWATGGIRGIRPTFVEPQSCLQTPASLLGSLYRSNFMNGLVQINTSVSGLVSEQSVCGNAKQAFGSSFHLDVPQFSNPLPSANTQGTFNIENIKKFVRLPDELQGNPKRIKASALIVSDESDNDIEILTAQDFRALTKLVRSENAFVNSHVHQVTDADNYGVEELWTRSGTGPSARGDCEDIAIEKRIRLIEKGFPANRLFFGVVFRPDVGLHTILVARMDKGDFVLDNLSPYVERWDKVNYSWISIQDRFKPDAWFTVTQQQDVVAVRSYARVTVSG
jgi:predicted transglutaminase-like cysteine proteinase